MKQKTFKGKLKKAGLYTLCYSPLVLAIGCFGLAAGGGVVSATFDDKKVAIYDEIYPKVLTSEEFVEHKGNKEEKLLAALSEKVLTPGEYTDKIERLTRREYVVDFAKTMPEFSSKIELAQEYEDKADAWLHSLWAFIPTLGFAVGSIFSIEYANYNINISNKDFDKVDDIEKKKKKLQAKQEKIAKKEKEL